MSLYMLRFPACSLAHRTSCSSPTQSAPFSAQDVSAAVPHKEETDENFVPILWTDGKEAYSPLPDSTMARPVPTYHALATQAPSHLAVVEIRNEEVQAMDPGACGSSEPLLGSKQHATVTVSWPAAVGRQLLAGSAHVGNEQDRMSFSLFGGEHGAMCSSLFGASSNRTRSSYEHRNTSGLQRTSQRDDGEELLTGQLCRL